MKLLILSKYSQNGASSRLRTRQYVEFLSKNGFEIEVQSLFSDEYLSALYSKKPRLKLALMGYINRFLFILTCPKADLVWIEKELFPWIPYSIECALMAFLPKKVVYDYDDAIFHSYDLHRLKIVRMLLGQKIKNLVKKSTLVTAGNEYLADYMRKSEAKKITILPTVVSKGRYTPEYTQNKARVIGWIGSPSTVKYLKPIRAVLAELATRFDFTFHCIGAEVSWPEIKTENRVWSESTEVEEIRKLDIGIMPLANTAWEKGKCAYKLIQYMACGKPVVASQVGANVEVVANDSSGFLVTSASEWKTALETLLPQLEKAEIFGRSGRKIFEEKYCLESQQLRLIEAFRAIIEAK